MSHPTARTQPWLSLLVEAATILGAYRGCPPELSSFAAHGVRVELGHVALAGQFLELPSPVPTSWQHDGRAVAYAVFEFTDVRRLEQQGIFQASPTDDSLHHRPVGLAGECAIEQLPDVYLVVPGRTVPLHWKQFRFKSAGTSLLVEAGHVHLYVGRQAFRQWGWPSGA